MKVTFIGGPVDGAVMEFPGEPPQWYRVMEDVGGRMFLREYVLARHSRKPGWFYVEELEYRQKLARRWK